MKAARLHATGDLRVADEPVPEPGPGMRLIQVTAVGICGSDLHWYDEAGIGDARLERPLVLGHESAGIIADGPRRGERVAIDPAIPCERCRQCRDGYRNLCPQVAFAGHGRQDGALRDFLQWPEDRLHPLPDKLTDADGAMLEPFGVAIHALDLGHLRVGAVAAVIGCGPIGLLLIRLLRVAGATEVVAVDPLPHRREAAAELGAGATAAPDDVTGPDVLPALAGGDIDTAFEIAGTDDAVRLSMEAVRPGGRVVLGGIPGDNQTTFPAATARRKGLTIAMVRRMNEVYPRAIDLAERGAVDLAPLVSHRLPLTRADEAFRLAAGRSGLKVLIEPGS